MIISLAKTLRPLNIRDPILTLIIRIRLQGRRVAQKEIDADPIIVRAHGDAVVVGVVWGRAEDGWGVGTEGCVGVAGTVEG